MTKVSVLKLEISVNSEINQQELKIIHGGISPWLVLPAGGAAIGFGTSLGKELTDNKPGVDAGNVAWSTLNGASMGTLGAFGKTRL
jgi:lactobin A/cerein 7B family class IIb bacteriocin